MSKIDSKGKMKSEEDTISIPVNGNMRKLDSGEWVIDKENSVYADIPVREIAEFIKDGFNGVLWEE